MRARLFRERNPEAFRIQTDTNPPVLAKVPIDLTQQEAGRIMARTLTVGDVEFKQASQQQTQVAQQIGRSIEVSRVPSWLAKARC